nr:transporter substrate-binding domain-containing protein [Pseudomonas sp. RIT-PI-AD]
MLFLLVVGSLRARAEEPVPIGAEDDWYPFTALKDGRIQGMSVDIVKAAFAASETPIRLVAYPYSRCMQLAKRGELAGCFNTAPDARIAEDFRLPREPLFSDDILLWTRREQPDPIDDLHRLNGRRVAVTLGYEYGEAFDTLNGMIRVQVRKDLNGFLMLSHRRVDYAVAYRGTAEQLFQDTPALQGLFVAVARVHQPQLYLSFSRNHPRSEFLLRRFELGMRRIRADGRYQAILDAWQPPGGDSPAH